MPSAAKLSKSPRKDPRPRHLNGSSIWARLKNKDPDKRYVFVSKSDIDAVSHYETAGYEVEVLTAQGVAPMGGKTCQLGDPIEVRGMVLYSVSEERFAEIELMGADGNGGQLEADRIEAMIVDRTGYDPLRGLHHGGVMRVENQTQRPEQELVVQ